MRTRLGKAGGSPALTCNRVQRNGAASRRAQRAGVRMAHVLDGRVPHALLPAVFTDDNAGTTVVPDQEEGDA